MHDLPTLNYQDPRQHRPPMSWKQFWLGVFGGLGFSVVYYLLLATASGNLFAESPLAGFGAITTKLVLGIVLALKPRWKGLGIGLITSIPVAMMVFMGLCFAIFAALATK